MVIQMSISPIASNPTPPTSPTNTEAASQAKSSHDAREAAAQAKADTVSISKQAQQLASDGDTAAQEVKESAAEKASEALRSKK